MVFIVDSRSVTPIVKIEGSGPQVAGPFFLLNGFILPHRKRLGVPLIGGWVLPTPRGADERSGALMFDRGFLTPVATFVSKVQRAGQRSLAWQLISPRPRPCVRGSKRPVIAKKVPLDMPQELIVCIC